GHPTLEAKRQQIQLTIGAITQYLAQTNDMSESVTKRLTKIQKSFLEAPIDQETMSALLRVLRSNSMDHKQLMNCIELNCKMN
ncbi:hypothetical protein BDP27DRAFT_1239063, partial [Rhodocollybia butyracea]